MALSYYQQQLTDLEKEIPGIASPIDPISYYKIIATCRQKLEKVVINWSTDGFATPTEETTFFRHVYPAMISHWRYWTELCRIQEAVPVGPTAAILDYYSQQLRVTSSLLLRREGSASWLEQIPAEYYPMFFCHDDQPIQLIDFPFLTIGKVPFNRYSADLAVCWALRRISTFICDGIELLALPGSKDPGRYRLRWALSKAALTELIYGLHEHGCFDGRPEISRIATVFSYIFDIDLGNIYKGYEGIRIRKKDRTPLLSGLVASMLRRLDHDDLYAL